ncbi:glycosyltransferase family 2 protein [Mucilaginibacter sp. UYCu711]|uniref:glycosyltransferase family 2 protein n=1 Tax=Mucilaginibacter sp. UYCu711 TaxID=3156339 RepID=UPI003D1F526C
MNIKAATVPEVMFTIIVPTYNREKLIRGTIQSLLDQTFKDYEIIVVDDGGNDNTKAVIDAFHSPIISYYWKENEERGATRNYGAKLAKGKYVNFFDSDDIAYDNHLQTAFDHIQLNNDAIIFHTGYDRRNSQMDKIGQSVIHTGLLNERIFKNNILSCNNVFIRKEEFNMLRFSENRQLTYGEDWLLWIRSSIKYPITGLPNVTSAIIEHDNRSMTNAFGDNILKSTNIILASLTHDNAQKNIIKKVTAEMYFLASLYYSIEGKKKECLNLFNTAFKLSPTIIYTKRTLAILKYLIRK